MIKKYTTNSPAQTKNLAKKIAASLSSHTILALVGELGAGKTQFTKGLAEYFKIKNPITSPTFVLLKPYPIKNHTFKQLIHIDCYRLSNPQELLAIGLNEFMQDKNNLIVIEWADKVKNILPPDTIWLKFKNTQKQNSRQISITK